MLEAKFSLEIDFTEYLFKTIKTRFEWKSAPQNKNLVPFCLALCQGCMKSGFLAQHCERSKQFCPSREALLDAIFNPKVKHCNIN